MLDFVNKHFQFLVICGLVLFLFFEGVFDRAPQAQPTIIVNTDTSWKNLLGRNTTQPVLIQTIPYPVDRLSTEYLPDTNYARLKTQFEAVVQELLAKNIQRDTLKIDSIGYVAVTDTVQKNLVTGRDYSYNLKYPTITNTVTIREPYKPRNQVLAGGGLSATPQLMVREVEAGLLFKDKKDRIYGLKGAYNFKYGPQIGVTHYRTIKFR